jgi:putative membrane protein
MSAPAEPAERGRLHPLAVVVFARRMIGASILPVLVVAFTWRPTFVVPGLLALAGIGLALVVLEWRRFTYRIEGGRLVIERGVLRHTTRVVPLDRIRGVELQAPWLHRVLGLVRVDVEAAAGGSDKAELSLVAVAAPEGERLRRLLLSGARAAPVDEAETEPARVLYRATPRLLVVGGLTSGRHILAPLAVIGVIANFADDLPGDLAEDLLGGAADRAPTDVLGVSVLVAAAVLLAAVFAAAGSLLADWEFELADDGERLVAKRGLLTRRSVVIDRPRVRGVDLTDSPLRRAFDLVGVHAIAGGIGGGRSGRAVLAPVLKMSQAHELLRELDPDAARPDAPLEPHPLAARTRRVVRAVAVPVVFALWALVLGWWWIAAALVVLALGGVPLGLDRYQQLGHAFDGRRLAVREGSLTRRWTSLDPSAVVSFAVERSPFQARAGLCTVVFHLGQGAGSRRVLDCSEEQAASLLAALDAPLLAPFVADAGPDRRLKPADARS